jgi:hypothetical protein
LQVHYHNGLLLHEPESITIDMVVWKGHFGTLMPFYAACERAGGFVGRHHAVLATPGKLPGGDQPLPQLAAESTLDDLALYRPARRKNGDLIDWGASIRCVALWQGLAGLEARICRVTFGIMPLDKAG